MTARLWASLGHHDGDGTFRIDGVTGPDEYSAIADNNIYTNLMAARNLRAAAAVAQRYPKRARELRVSADEVAAWLAAADGIMMPYDAGRGVHCQAEGFTEHQVWDFARTSPAEYPLLAHFPYFDLYRKQVVKQADLVLAIHQCPDAFTEEEKARDFEYYEALTVRDSSLSACSQAVVAADTGHLDLAYDYLAETALMDMADLEHNTRDGLHIAALAGSWIVLVQGFGGMRYRPGQPPSFAPRLPPALTRLTFTVILRGRHLRVEVMPGNATYIVDGEGPPLEITHYGSPVAVAPGKPEKRDIPVLPTRPRPSQPPGREPDTPGLRAPGRPVTAGSAADPAAADPAGMDLDVHVAGAAGPGLHVGVRLDAADLLFLLDLGGVAGQQDAPALAQRLIEPVHLERDLAVQPGGELGVRAGAQHDGVPGHAEVDGQDHRAVGGVEHDPPDPAGGQQLVTLDRVDRPQHRPVAGRAVPGRAAAARPEQGFRRGLQRAGQLAQGRPRRSGRVVLEIGQVRNAHPGSRRNFLPGEIELPAPLAHPGAEVARILNRLAGPAAATSAASGASGAASGVVLGSHGLSPSGPRFALVRYCFDHGRAAPPRAAA